MDDLRILWDSLFLDYCLGIIAPLKGDHSMHFAFDIL